MRKTCVIAAVGLCLVIGTACAAAYDTIKTSSGTVVGRISTMSPTSVTITRPGAGGLRQDVTVNTIETIYFDEEPAQMKTIRAYIRDGQNEDALESLEKLNLDDINRDEVKQDIAFHKALCRAKLALAGTGKVLTAAGEMGAFRKRYPGNYHYLEATELMGNLALALGKHNEGEILRDIGPRTLARLQDAGSGGNGV